MLYRYLNGFYNPHTFNGNQWFSHNAAYNDRSIFTITIKNEKVALDSVCDIKVLEMMQSAKKEQCFCMNFV